MQGRVEKIWENQSNSGKYWVLSIEGERYAVWDRKQMVGLRPGSLVDYDYRESGQYRNISRLNPVRSSGSMDPYLEERELRIIRMSCLRSACQMTYNIDMNWEDKVKETLILARRFDRYVLGTEKT